MRLASVLNRSSIEALLFATENTYTYSQERIVKNRQKNDK